MPLRRQLCTHLKPDKRFSKAVRKKIKRIILQITFTVQGHSNIQYLPVSFQKELKMLITEVLKWIFVVPSGVQHTPQEAW